MKWRSKVAKLGKINPLRIGGNAWKGQKAKAAVVLKTFSPLVRQAVKVDMKRNWYKHIDKAIEGNATPRDERHWKRMYHKFKREIAGPPNQLTVELRDWLKEMPNKVKFIEKISLTKDDYDVLKKLRSYMESCEENALDLYIIKNKLVEGI